MIMVLVLDLFSGQCMIKNFKKMKVFSKKEYPNSSYLGKYGFYIPSFLKINNYR